MGNAEQDHLPTVPADSLTVNVDERPGAVVVTVAGEVDILTAPAVRDAVDQAVARLENRVLVIDVQSVTFFGSQGLQILAVTAGRLQDMGLPDLRVVALRTHAVLRPIQICGLDAVLRLYGSVDDALAE